LRIQPHVGKHAGEEDVLGRPEFGDRDRLALQLPDRANPVRPEQLETSHVHATQGRDGSARVELDEQRPDEPIETSISPDARALSTPAMVIFTYLIS